jgi:serine/threonine-protein kinase
MSQSNPNPDQTRSESRDTLVPDKKAQSALDPQWPAIPGYEFIEELGRGATGVVYKARHIGLDRVAALKVILAGHYARAEDLARFRFEAQIIARLRHANIVEIYDMGMHAGLPFFTLEFVPGGTLAGRINGQPQQPHESARLIETVARAIDVAHKNGVVHRDLKPANILLMADGTPKVTDFGLAKRIDVSTGPTQSGVVVGTPSYMAPEQAVTKKKGIGPHTDVHALGAILYEMLTGRPPFRGNTVVETILQVLNDVPIPPSQRVRGIPRGVEVICLKCLQKGTTKRYPSALALAEDLARFRAGEAADADIAGKQKKIRRGSLQKISKAALVIGLAAVATFSLGFWALSRHFADTNIALPGQTDNRVAADDIVVTVRDMIKEYETNESFAQRKYAGSMVVVSGFLLRLSHDPENKLFAELKPNRGMGGRITAKCFFRFKNESDILSAIPGSPVQLRGLCDGKDGNSVILNDCRYIKSVPDLRDIREVPRR